MDFGFFLGGKKKKKRILDTTFGMSFKRNTATECMCKGGNDGGEYGHSFFFFFFG
jgi:hypothetical protein